MATSTDDWAESSRHWGVVIAIALADVALAVLLAYVVFWAPASFLADVKTVLARSVVLVPLSVVLLVWILSRIRHWAFRRHIRAGGPIQLVSFEDATTPPAPVAPACAFVPRWIASSANGAADGAPARAWEPVVRPLDGPEPSEGDPPVAQLAIHLRHRLSELRLSAPSAIPGAQRSSDFVELLETTKVDMKQPFAALGSILRLIRPAHVYELRAKVMRRDDPLPYGVAIELTRLLDRRSVFRTYWDDTWKHALDRAASGVGARVVPHSRQEATSPWATWHGTGLSEEAFHAYQLAQRRTEERRFDEALAHYYAALRCDPVNGHLRYELGQLQESRGLYLDALWTYFSTITSAKQRRFRWRDRTARKARRHMEILTRYRFAVLLGFGERLAGQWLPRPRDGDMRSDCVKALRERLGPILLDRYLDREGRIVRATDDDLKLLGLYGLNPDPARARLEGLLEVSGATTTPAEAPERARRLAQVRLVFQLFAEEEVSNTLEKVRYTILRPSLPLGRTALALSPTWATLRTDHARALAPDGPPDKWPPSPKSIHKLWCRRARLLACDCGSREGSSTTTTQRARMPSAWRTRRVRAVRRVSERLIAGGNLSSARLASCERPSTGRTARRSRLGGSGSPARILTWPGCAMTPSSSASRASACPRSSLPLAGRATPRRRRSSPSSRSAGTAGA